MILGLSDRELATTITNLYFNRLKIHVVRNGLTFIEDIRDRDQWTREMLRMSETTVMEILPESHVVGKMQQIMFENGMDMSDQNRFIFDLFGGNVKWSQVTCQ